MKSSGQNSDNSTIGEHYLRKITRISEKMSKQSKDFSQSHYSNPNEYFKRRADLIKGWGTELHPGDSILELGCGDGFLGCLLAKEGFHYKGIDVSRGMIEVARARAKSQRVEAEFECADMHEVLRDAKSYDAIIGLMNTFFQYTPEPASFLEQVRPYVRKKIVVDWKHRTPAVYPGSTISLKNACDLVEAAGYKASWQPIFLPSTKKLPGFVIYALSRFECVPGIRTIILNRKFWALIRGEPIQPAEVLP